MNRFFFKTSSITLFAMLAAGCGGGGGGGVGSGVADNTATDTSSGAASFSIINPTKLSSLPSLGQASFPTAINDYGVGFVSFSQSSASSTVSTADAIYNAAISNRFQIYPTSHLTSEVLASWAGGWTGSGVTISIIDDYVNSSGVSSTLTPSITRTANYVDGFWGTVQGTYDLVYEWKTSFTHGQSVSNIAGGDADGQQLVSTGITVKLVSAIRKGCATIVPGPNGFIRDFCAGDFYLPFSSFQEKMTLTYKKVAGVAKQSLVVDNNVNLSSRQNPLQTVADIQGHLKNSAYVGVVNLSLGSDIPTSGRNLNEVLAEVSKFPISKIDAVITVAAGNGGAACANQDLNGCNSVAVAMAFQPATAASTIVVGATSGSGSTENIATYSTRAGILAQRFVLASGVEGDLNILGTSFAAPRVAGIAAILKQKYPSLTAAQIANVILLSASKDINNDGFDDFIGVSPIYGHGKASLTRALSLAGAL